jgi:hypothetical protein
MTISGFQSSGSDASNPWERFFNVLVMGGLVALSKRDTDRKTVIIDRFFEIFRRKGLAFIWLRVFNLKDITNNSHVCTFPGGNYHHARFILVFSELSHYKNRKFLMNKSVFLSGLANFFQLNI